MERVSEKGNRRWRNRELVRELDSRRSRSLWWLLLGIIAALAPLAVYLIEQIQYVQIRYETENVRRDYNRFLEAEQRFRVQRAMLENLPKVEDKARRLGLVQPTPENVLVIRSETAVLEDLLARAPDKPSRKR
jgi:hypothetical protein